MQELTDDLKKFINMAGMFGGVWRGLSVQPSRAALMLDMQDEMRVMPEAARLNRLHNKIVYNGCPLYFRVIRDEYAINRVRGLTFDQIYGANECCVSLDVRGRLRQLNRATTVETQPYVSFS